MDYTQATNELKRAVTLAEVAKEVGVHPVTVRKARGAAKQPPPEGWERAVVRLARKRSAELDRLAEEVEAQMNEPAP